MSKLAELITDLRERGKKEYDTTAAAFFLCADELEPLAVEHDTMLIELRAVIERQRALTKETGNLKYRACADEFAQAMAPYTDEAEQSEPQKIEQLLERICLECGRMKATNAEDVLAGMCPKWWAIRDPEAAADCTRHAAQKCECFNAGLAECCCEELKDIEEEFST